MNPRLQKLKTLISRDPLGRCWALKIDGRYWTVATEGHAVAMVRGHLTADRPNSLKLHNRIIRGLLDDRIKAQRLVDARDLLDFLRCPTDRVDGGTEPVRVYSVTINRLLALRALHAAGLDRSEVCTLERERARKTTYGTRSQALHVSGDGWRVIVMGMVRSDPERRFL